MAERKCIYDPLAELMAYYADKTVARVQTDRAALSVEERLKQRIIDGDQIGIDDDLAEAMRSHEPLAIVNTILLDGMKVVGELFGSGQMQLPFVLQSAETMKRAVAYLEPHMEKVEGSARGTMVLATVKGDVHDIGKNLVDIILSNNGYQVVNLGIKIPLEAMLDAAREHNASAIGMSGLLVKSTLVMKENLELMRGRGIDIPVVLGGAALTRRYVEGDLREVYGPNVAYAEDAFAGLHYMERLASGQENWTALERNKSQASEETAAAGDASRDDARRKLVARGSVVIRPAAEEDVERLAELMEVVVDDLRAVDVADLLVVELEESVIGGGRVRPIEGGGAELTNITLMPEQWSAGVGYDLVRALRRHARRNDAETLVFVTCDPNDAELVRFYRTLGFDQVPLDDLRATVAAEKINWCVEQYGREPALFFAKPASALGELPVGSSLETALHLIDEQRRDADHPTSSETFESDAGMRIRRVTSNVARDVPVPPPPFWGSRVVESVRLEKVFEYINEVALFRGQWQVRRGRRSVEEYQRELEGTVRPKFEELKLRAKRENVLTPKVIYGYFPVQSDGDTVIVYRPASLDPAALVAEWPQSGSHRWSREELVEWQRFTFPRQHHGRHLCLADFFRSTASGEFDTMGAQIVTVGERATTYAQELFNAGSYADYLYFHGLGVETAEALAEYWHRSIRIELGIADRDAQDIRRLFAQGYQGSRYSFGYPACPNLEDQQQIFAMLDPSRVGVALSDEWMLEPEQSTSAIVVHHPEAKYFNVREE